MKRGEQLTIYITAKDIREGKPTNANKCPVARATRRAVLRTQPDIPDGDLSVQVVVQVSADVWAGNVWYHVGWWQTSNAVKDWIGKFDRGEPVKPAKFILTAR